MVTSSTDRSNHLPQHLELPKTPQQADFAQLDDEQSKQNAQWLNIARSNQTFRQLRQTYHLERRTFL